MTRQIRTAADELRALVGALPEEIRDVWEPNRGAGQVVGAKYAVDPCYFPVADFVDPAAMEHIARTASPDVVLALADLLDAIDEVPVLGIVQDAADRLAALITREAT